MGLGAIEVDAICGCVRAAIGTVPKWRMPLREIEPCGTSEVGSKECRVGHATNEV